MAYENEKALVPAAEETTEAAETNLQIEELESLVAPSTVWGT